MTKNEPMVVSETNLSLAWGRVFLKMLERGIKEISPVLVTIRGFPNGLPAEREDIRNALDKELQRPGTRLNCTRVASTIFPLSLWNPEVPRAHLYERYERIWAHIRRCPANYRGTYFQRLVLFAENGRRCNQLEHIINVWKAGSPRRSALQASIFDPLRDHSPAPMLGFPCLQHVTFAPIGSNGLCATGFYATQYIFERAYGNYLGLCWLGRFMAHEVGLELAQVNCITGIALLGKAGKESLVKLKSHVEHALSAV